jgi:hypothetical protein
MTSNTKPLRDLETTRLRTNLIQLITSLEINEDGDSGRAIENDYPEHGVCPAKPEIGDWCKDHCEL